MTYEEMMFIAASTAIGAGAMLTGYLVGYRRALRDEASKGNSSEFDRGVRAGQRMIASFLAGSGVPTVREIGRNLLAKWEK